MFYPVCNIVACYDQQVRRLLWRVVCRLFNLILLSILAVHMDEWITKYDRDKTALIDFWDLSPEHRNVAVYSHELIFNFFRKFSFIVEIIQLTLIKIAKNTPRVDDNGCSLNARGV